MKKIVLLILTVCLTITINAQDNPELAKEIETIENSLTRNIIIKGDDSQTFNILDRMAYYKVPGISIAIVENGKLKWAKGYGMANTNTGTKVDANTLFQAGSISKPVAALSVLKLYEMGKVDLDTDVSTYLTSWSLPESAFTDTEKVTLRRLLTHTAGTTVHGFPGYKQSDDFPAINMVLNGEGNTPEIKLDTIPGSIWRYSGGGYTIMENVFTLGTQLEIEKFLF